MEPLLKESLVLFQKNQCLVDTLFRDTLCGYLTQTRLSELKMSHSEYVELHRSEWEDRKSLIQECITMWKFCLLTYNSLHQLTYDSLESGNTQQTKHTTAPIDPCSALNIIECGDSRGDVQIRLFNDNESLFRYDSSAFANVKDSAEKTSKISKFYENAALKIGEFLERVQIKMGGDKGPVFMREEMCLVRERVFERMNELRESKEELGESLGTLEESLVEIERERVDERRNILVYLGNLVAKYNEVARLRDNLLRAYSLTTTQQKKERVVSLF